METVSASQEPSLQPQRAQDLLGLIEQNIHRVIVGKERVVRLAAAGLVAGGPGLPQGLPRTGKKKLARAPPTPVGRAFPKNQSPPPPPPPATTGPNTFNPKDP